MKIVFRILVLLTIAAGACTPKQDQKVETPAASQTAIRDVTYKVEGMTCGDCEKSICKGVKELSGIRTVEASHENSTARVVFDPSQINEEGIIAAIEKRGYKVVRNN